MDINYETDIIPVQQLTQVDVDKYTPCFLDKRTNRMYVVEVPDSKLTGISSIRIQGIRDIEHIPKKIQGTYWICTNEPITHCLHKGVNIPKKLENNFQIVYSGSSCDLRDRAKQHLLRISGVYGTMSGISVDILQQAPTNKSSHAKCLWTPAKNKKLPKILKIDQYVKPVDKEDILNSMYLSAEEQSYVSNTNDIFFKNGINVEDEKHRPYKWIFYYTQIMNHSIRDFIEIKWRKLYGIPVLCSYSEGR